MAKIKTSRYDVAEHLRTPKEMAAYLEACLAEADGDAYVIAKALGDIARAKGMTQVARDSGLSRESLYKALSGERIPTFDTILKVVSALGLSLHAQAGQGWFKRRGDQPHSILLHWNLVRQAVEFGGNDGLATLQMNAVTRRGHANEELSGIRVHGGPDHRVVFVCYPHSPQQLREERREFVGVEVPECSVFVHLVASGRKFARL